MYANGTPVIVSHDGTTGTIAGQETTRDGRQVYGVKDKYAVTQWHNADEIMPTADYRVEVRKSTGHTDAASTSPVAYPTTRETGRHGQTPEALAFQIALVMFDMWPVDCPFDAFTADLICESARDTADDIYLRELADR